VHLRTSPDDGLTWGHPTRVTSGGTALYPCSLELSGSVLHLVWPDSRNRGLWEPYYKRSTDGGKTWGEDIRLSPGTDLFRLGTAVSGSCVHVVWFNKHLLEKVPAGLIAVAALAALRFNIDILWVVLAGAAAAVFVL
jgi:hypothetical protein